MVTLKLQIPDMAYPADSSAQQVGRFIWYPTPAPALPAGVSPRLNGKKVAIVGGSDELVNQIMRALENHGASVYRLAPSGIADDLAALAFLKQAGNIDGIIDLNIDTAFTWGNRDHWEKPLRQTVTILKAVYEDWLEETDGQRLFYVAVTYMGGQMGYTDSCLRQPLGGIWAGLAKTLHREIPNCNVRVVDFASQDHSEMAALLVKELYRWGLFEIGYVNGTRYTLTACKEAVLSPTSGLSPSDLLLISGGGRGIGFALARALAENFGCRVVATGRHPLPADDEPWLSLSEPLFKRYQQQRLRTIPRGKSLLEVRRELEQLRQIRELYQNMQEVKAKGLRITYETCDFTSQEQVNALISHLGPELNGIIHNAGIDAPIRLPAKSSDAFIRTVQTKVSSFLNLIQELEGKSLDFFCNVGSLTGRFGGMVGQIDYAAANEGLTRLGLWAERTLLPMRYPIKTLCWPVWDRLGMITNFEAALKYMTALRVEEGLYYWQCELLVSSSGEITFIGPIGKALSPVQAQGYLLTYQLPGFKAIYPQIFYLGEVQYYKPGHSLQTSNTLDVRFIPCFSDFQVGMTNALPISLLLEHIVHMGAWLTSLEQPAEYLQAIRKVTINLEALKASGQEYRLEKRATAGWQDDTWIVEVDIVKLAETVQEFLAHAELVYGREPNKTELCPSVDQNASQEVILPAPTALTWQGNLFKLVKWHSHGEGILIGSVKPSYAADLWSIPFPPEMYLASAAIENIIRAAIAKKHSLSTLKQIVLDSIKLFKHTNKGDQIVGLEHTNKWYILDQSCNQVTCLLETIEFL